MKQTGKKQMKKWLATGLSLMLVASSAFAVGCSREDDEEPIDETKTTLFVGIYECGFGEEYAYALKKRFEEAHKDDQFPDGTVGVQVKITPQQSYSWSGLSSTIQGWNQDVYMTEGVVGYNEAAKNGAFLELTDIVQETLPGENVSIERKMNESYKDWYNIDGKYYAVPQYESSTVINYDIELFETENLYFAADGGFVSNSSESRSKGPDGKTGDIYSMDDGLPATYDEFFLLCDRMVGKGITPILWPGKLQGYVSDLLMTLWADYEASAALKDGEAFDEYLRTHFEFNGKTDVVTGFNGGTPSIIQKEITETEGYEVFKQAGLYYALDFIYRIMQNRSYYNYTDCFGGGLDHLGAQEQFVYGSHNSEGKPIGMYVDGTWWYNEAKGARENYVEEWSGDPNHRYGVMSIPKVSADYASSMTLYDSGISAIFVNAKIADYKKEIAKDFVQFCLTNQSLSEFTRITSTTCPYTYTLTAEDEAQLSPLGEQLYQIHLNSTYFMPMKQNSIFLSDTSLARSTGFWNIGNSNTPTNSFLDKIDGNGGLDSKGYFNGLGSYYQTSWGTYNK